MVQYTLAKERQTNKGVFKKRSQCTSALCITRGQGDKFYTFVIHFKRTITKLFFLILHLCSNYVWHW